MDEVAVDVGAVAGDDVAKVLLVSEREDGEVKERVEPRKRPAPNHGLLGFYADLYPGYPIAPCCLGNADAAEARPLLPWYQPLEHDRMVLPAIDCHPG
ncbi:MAG TPA: hypothetical protein VHZ03_16825, partial [Trebonia sp.]|nr:hypothetical protein [Trebonia sp.]